MTWLGVRAWWSAAALPWLRKWWKWLAVGAAVVVSWLVGRAGRKPVAVRPSTEAADAEFERARLEYALWRAVEDAGERRSAEFRDVLDHHSETIQKLSAEQAEQALELLDNPGSLNKYLLEVGREYR